MASSSRVLTDHDEIREWAEERGAKPACVRNTGSGEIGMIRLEFPGAPNANDSNLEEIGWEDFFEKFDESRLALLVQDELAGGGQSNFNKLIGRETAAASEKGEKTSRRAKQGQGIAKGKSASSKKSAARSGSKSASAKSSGKKSSGKKIAARSAAGGAAKKSSSSRGASGREAAAKSSGSKSAARKTASKSSKSSQNRSAKKSSGSGSKKSAAKKSANNRGGGR